MKRLPFRRAMVPVLALAVLATAMALWLGVFGQEPAAASPGIDLVITKTASPTEATGVDTGDTITYTLTVTNTGDTATVGSVLIRDTLGTGLTYVSASGTGVTCDASALPVINCTTDAAMAVGESRTVTVVVTVSAASGNYVYNGAYVDPSAGIAEDNEDADDPDFDCSATGADVGEGTDTAPATEPDNYDCTRHGVDMPDLTITKAASPSEATAVSTGSTITYTLTVSNSAAAAGTATNVPIRDTIGSGLALSSITPGSDVTCADTTPPEINCTAGSIAPGVSRTLTIAVTVSATSGAVLNGAYVDRLNTITEINEDDDDVALGCAGVGEGLGQLPSTEPDNFDCTSHTATALSDLTITKTASPSETTVVDTGDTITYTLTVTNSGAATATSVDIQDTIGSGLTLSSVTPGTGVTCADTTAPEINCIAASIASGESRTVTIVVTVSATSGTVLNGAEVDPDNDIAEVNEDADDPTLSCSAVGEGTDAGEVTEADNYDCTSHAFAEVSPTPTPGQLRDCPLSGKWAMSVWDGPSGTATGTALATCTGVTINAAYALDRVTNSWSRYFPGRSDINTLLTLSDMQAIFTRGQ
jgi:uncharacterized repeat protein (TIGR01451 family)